jgi:hypothetical protein
MRRLVALAAFVLLLAVPPPAAAKQFLLPQADVRVQVEADGALQVEEDITFTFLGPFSGAFREIPLAPGESIRAVRVSEGGRAYAPGASAELGSAGAPDTYGVADTEDGARIVWHFVALDETRTFTVSYVLTGVTVVHDDVVDVNLQVWGEEWEVGLGRLTASIALPGEAAPEDFLVFGHPAWVRGDVSRGPSVARLRAVDVPPHQYVELRVIFPRTLLAPGAPATTGSTSRSRRRPSHPRSCPRCSPRAGRPARTSSRRRCST